MGEVGMSISLSSLSESFAFCRGALTRMPAVEAFAFYSAVAILADYVLQITCLAAMIVLDSERTENMAIECLPCVRVRDLYILAPCVREFVCSLFLHVLCDLGR